MTRSVPLPEAVTAVRHALTLGSSMVIGMGIGLLVRLLAPRLLGPVGFGEYRIAESLAEMVFVLLTLGVDTVIRREATVTSGGVGNYLWSLVTLRLTAAVLLVGGMAVALAASGTGVRRVLLFAVIAGAQVLVVLNNSYAAVEHAGGAVAWIARVNVAFKAFWASLAIGLLVLVPSGLGLGIAFLASEAARFAMLTRRTLRNHPPRRPDLRIAAATVAVSLPFFINYLAHGAYARMGTWWLAATLGDREVGWYGAASNVAAVALIGMPLVTWVLVPAAVRAALRSREELDALMGGALRMALLGSVPVSLALALGAPTWMPLVFGAAFTLSVPAAQLLAPTVAMAHISTICAIALIQHGRVRAVALVSVGGLVVSLMLHAMLVPRGAMITPGHGAAAAAGAALATEAAVTVAMVSLSWSRSWWAPLTRTALGLLLGTLATSVAVTQLPVTGPAAAITGAVVFCAILGMSGAIGARDLEFCRRALPGWRKHEPVTA